MAEHTPDYFINQLEETRLILLRLFNLYRNCNLNQVSAEIRTHVHNRLHVINELTDNLLFTVDDHTGFLDSSSQEIEYVTDEEE